MLFGGFREAFAVDIQALIADEVVSDLKRKAVGGVKVEAGGAVNDGLTVLLHLLNDFIQVANAVIQGLVEAVLFPFNGLEDRLAVLAEFRISVAVGFDDGIRDFAHEGLFQTDLLTEADSAANDHTANVVAAHVARDNAVGNQERGGAAVVGNHAVRREVGVHFLFGLAGKFAKFRHGRGEEVGLIVGILVLEDGDDALEAHAGVDILVRKRDQGVLINAVVLHEDQVPQLHVTVAVAVHAADMVRIVALLAVIRAHIHMNFGAGTARTGVGHFPEVLFTAEIHDVARVHTGLRAPNIVGFLIRGNLSLFVFEAGGVELRGIQTPNLRQQFPSPADGFLLVVISEGPVAEHFEEGMVAVITADIFKVVMLARDAHTLLRVGRAGIRAAVGPEENVFELDHAGIREQQRGIPGGDQAGGTDSSVSFFLKKFDKLSADLIAA